jgi:hypothetical protein
VLACRGSCFICTAQGLFSSPYDAVLILSDFFYTNPLGLEELGLTQTGAKAKGYQADYNKSVRICSQPIKMSRASSPAETNHQ